MAEIVPVDQFLDWYPGWTPELIGSPWLAEHPGPFTKADEERFWFIDFHWPRGFSPMGFLYVTDCAAWGTQTAAHWLPLPPGKGLATRLGGPFPYEGEIATTSEWELGHRAARIERNLPRFLQNFDAIWEERKWELELGLGHFEGYDFAGKALADIGQYLIDARTFHKRAWEIHFELMYPLLGIYLQLYGLCANNGIDPSNVSKFFQGRDSKIMETDRAMWELVAEAKRLDVADLFDAEPSEIRDRLAKAGGNASVWLTRFDDFLKVYGWRTEGIADTNIPSWIENPESPLGQIRNFLAMDEPHDFEQAAEAARAERDEAVEAARSQLSGEMVTAFDELLAVNQVANFAWWNEDHNYYIDLRASIPLRRAALALGAACDADTYDDGLFLFYPEALDVAFGRKRWQDLQSLATARHEYYDHYQAIRETLPKVVGTLPDKVEDPVLIEIFGMRHHYFEALKSDPDATELRGFPASTGTVTGRARVMLSATELPALEEGEILVCEATSPNWTPAFALIAGCVCDGGGSLTHAAIVSREYGIPCVVGCSVATSRIRTGDLVEVDGAKGTVTIVERAGG
jgi:phosphohistidine swiveling domain-containing protein